MLLSHNFIGKRGDVESARIRENIDSILRTIEQMPGMGSTIVADTICQRYGKSILKAVVRPYLIIYSYDRPTDTVYVHDLINSHLMR